MALNFEKLTIEKLPELAPYFCFARNRASDNTAGATFMWRDYLKTEYAVSNGCLLFIARLPDGTPVFSFPLGEDWRAGLLAVSEYCKIAGAGIVFCPVMKEQLPLLKEVFGEISAETVDGFADYLYVAESFLEFRGKKLHGQRNHLNFFRRQNPEYRFEEITAENLAEVKTFFQALPRLKSDELFHWERAITAEVLENYSAYGMVGGVLKINGAAVGFSIGEVCGDTLFIHIEKADSSVRGAYQALLSEFVKKFGQKAQFVNREEDCGDPGLRQSKLAYHPCELIEKYTVKV